MSSIGSKSNNCDKNSDTDDGGHQQKNAIISKANSFGSYETIIKAIFYDVLLWFFNMVIHTFFRDIESRGKFFIPKEGPVVFVIAPHSNQFIDPLVVMSKVKQFSGRRISFLIAGKSYRQKLIGSLSSLSSPIVVERAQDLMKPATGKIFVKEVETNGLEVQGEGTRFTKECMEKGLIGNAFGHAQIKSIVSDTKIILQRPFPYNPKNPIPREKEIVRTLKNGSDFSTAPHVDNNKVFQNVFHHLQQNKILGIFPEGGSHDRTDLLPLKPGVAIMALGAAAQSVNPDINIKIVPVGLNYFHPNKFRSRVVIEFGNPIEVNKERGEKYAKNPRNEVAKLLENISLNLKEVTVTSNDYETLKVVHVVRRLYTADYRATISLPYVLEVNRRLVRIFQEQADNKEILEIRKSILDYSKRLDIMGLHDHQVPTLTRSNRFMTFIKFVSRLFKTLLFVNLSLPGVFLFSPVFIVARRISKKKAQQALTNSQVKVKAIDVIGSWKIIVALVLAPCLYVFYSIVGTFLILRLRILPLNVPTIAIFLFCYAWSVLTTYSSMRVGEIGVDYYKSLKPLFYSVLSHHFDVVQIEDLKAKRQELTEKVSAFFREYAPDIVDEYHEFYESLKNERAAHASNVVPSTAFINSISESVNLESLADVPIFSNLMETINTESVEGATSLCEAEPPSKDNISSLHRRRSKKSFHDEH